MKYLDLTLHLPESNLACDEALLDWCESGCDEEILRVWEPREHFVVLGYTNAVATEVNLPLCQARSIPVLRRCSGGGTVLQGPGCLNYSLILRMRDSPQLAGVSEANQFIMERHREAVEALLNAPIEIQGFTDLTLRGLKFSGNAQRRKRNFLLFHGTFLLDFDLSLIEQLLPLPAKQPLYRQHRNHAEFLTNLGVAPDQLKQCLQNSWGATEMLDGTPQERVDRLVEGKYAADEWNLKF